MPNEKIVMSIEDETYGKEKQMEILARITERAFRIAKTINANKVECLEVMGYFDNKENLCTDRDSCITVRYITYPLREKGGTIKN